MAGGIARPAILRLAILLLHHQHIQTAIADRQRLYSRVRVDRNGAIGQVDIETFIACKMIGEQIERIGVECSRCPGAALLLEQIYLREVVAHMRHGWHQTSPHLGALEHPRHLLAHGGFEIDWVALEMCRNIRFACEFFIRDRA